MTQKELARNESIESLRKLLNPGDTVKTILRHVSKSGMQRRISLVIARNNEVIDITWHAARALGDSIKRRGQYVQDAGMVVNGCGMDMGFHIVYSLSRTLFPDGFGVPCSNCNIYKADREGSNIVYGIGVCKGLHTYRGRNGDTSGWDTDGGYALKQGWL